MFELNFNYTSKTQIHFLFNTVHITDGASLLGPYLSLCLGSVHLQGRAGISASVCLVFACALSSMSVLSLVCLHRQVVSTGGAFYAVCPAGLASSSCLHLHSLQSSTQLAAHSRNKHVLFRFNVSCWLTVEMPLVVFITNMLRVPFISPFLLTYTYFCRTSTWNCWATGKTRSEFR